MSAPPKTYLLDEDQLKRLRSIASLLQGGNDKERDWGHMLWNVVLQVEAQEVDDGRS